MERPRWGHAFAGSLFAMTDAFYMLMLMANLGRDYIVWDKAASIRDRKPGKGPSAPNSAWRTPHFDDIRDTLETLPKCEPTFFMWKRSEP